MSKKQTLLKSAFFVAACFFHFNALGPEELPQKQTLSYFESILKKSENFSKVSLKNIYENDKKHREKLTLKALMLELKAVQELYEKYNNQYTLIKEKGVRLYNAETTLKLFIITHFHWTRFDYLMDYENRVIKKKEPFSITNNCSEYEICGWGPMPIGKPKQVADFELVVKAIQDLQYPKKLTQGIKVYISPIVMDTNGEFFPRWDNVMTYVHKRWRVSESLIAHEVGHAIHYRLLYTLLLKNDYGRYWKLREVEPIAGQRSYPHINEVIAEDLRILYGGSPRATIKRKNPGVYGDLRDYPQKHKRVKQFLDQKIKNYRDSKNHSHILFPHLVDKLPGHLYFPEDKKTVTFDIRIKRNFWIRIWHPVTKKGQRSWVDIKSPKRKRGTHTIDFEKIKAIQHQGKLLPGKYSMAIYDADEKKYDVTHITTFDFAIADENFRAPSHLYRHD